MANDLDQSLTINELARRWRCRPSKVRAMIRDGSLGAIAIGGRKRITPAAIAAAERGVLAVEPATPRKQPDSIRPSVRRLLGI